MRQLQNDPEKIRSFYQNHRSNMPPDSAAPSVLCSVASAKKCRFQFPYMEQGGKRPDSTGWNFREPQGQHLTPLEVGP